MNFAVIVAVAAVLVWYDMRFFAFYSFFVTVGLIIHFTGRLWKLVKVSHAATNAKILVVAQKVGVSDEDYDRIVAYARATDPEGWAVLERDAKGLGYNVPGIKNPL